MLKVVIKITPSLLNTPNVVRIPILREIVEKIITNGYLNNIEAANLDTIFTLIYARFLRLSEISYIVKDRL